MRTLNQSKALGTWVSFPKDDTFKLQIRPLNILSMNRPPSDKTTTENQIWEWFDYILIGWEGYENEEGQPVECNEDNKKLVFNFDQEVVTFCIESATKLREEIVSIKEVNNLKK